jgi:hypothetical protein
LWKSWGVNFLATTSVSLLIVSPQPNRELKWVTSSPTVKALPRTRL